MVVDENGIFREESFQKAVAVLSDAAQSRAPKQGKSGRKGSQRGGALEEESDIFKIVRMIMEREYDPVSAVPDCRFQSFQDWKASLPISKDSC